MALVSYVEAARQRDSGAGSDVAVDRAEVALKKASTAYFGTLDRMAAERLKATRRDAT